MKLVGHNDSAVECEGCNRWQHAECTGMTKGEFEIIKQKNCKLAWLCIDCKPRLLKNQDTEGQKLDTLTGKMQRILTS
jgi:hypothetical protein